MKYIIVNLSPRVNGTSRMLAEYVASKLSSLNEVQVENLYASLTEMDGLLDKIRAAESIVLIGPCYVTTFPADTTMLLERMAEKEQVLHGQSLYGMIQGGMPYVHTHECGIKMLECFGEANNAVFKGGFVMGGGAAIYGQPLEKVLGAKTVIPAINQFIENIASQEYSPKELYRQAAVRVPAIAARMLAALMGIAIRKDFKSKGINYKVPSPYLHKEKVSVDV